METVLGAYLEAVCVDGLTRSTHLLASFDGGHLALVSAAPAPAAAVADGSSQAQVHGPADWCCAAARAVLTAETLGEALR